MKRKALLTRCERTLSTSAKLGQMAAGMTERSGASMCARWLRMIPDRNGMTPAGTDRDSFSPLSPSLWRMSTSALERVEKSLLHSCFYGNNSAVKPENDKLLLYTAG